jgi:hypothetical protein
MESEMKLQGKIIITRDDVLQKINFKYGRFIMQKSYLSLFSLILGFFFFAGFSLLGREQPGKYQSQSNSYNSLGTPQSSVFNINNISSWQSHDGKSANDPNGNSGVIYPRSTAGVIFQDGIIWGGFLLDPVTGQQIPNQPLRVGGQTYRQGTQPGRIISIGTPEDPNLPHVRIYRIRKDYLTVSDDELRLDAAELNQIDPSQVTQAMIDAVRAQYTTDWNEWPVPSGAPFYDLNNNGIYEPALGEEPGLQNADMVLWFVCNDLNQALTIDLYGSDPIGLELQVTMWGYRHQAARWGQGAIRRYRIINKGEFQLDSMYISQWADPDVGNAGNDFVGCDTLIHSGFGYNGEDNDPDFDLFGLAPPAVGYSILQGPIMPGDPGDTVLFDFKRIPGFKNIPMTSFGYFGFGSPFGEDPELGEYKGTREWYNLLRGFSTLSDDVQNPIPYLAGSGPNVGQPTKFPLSGDPVNDPNGLFGDVDGQGNNQPPGDRRMAICSGPFEMMPGDTQEVVIAMFGGIGDTRLQSVTEMKQNIEFMRSWYGKPILIPQVSHQISHPGGTTTELQVQVNLQDFSDVTGSEASFYPASGSEPPFTLPLFDDGMHNDSLAGDGIWGNSVTQNNLKYPYNGDLTVNTISDLFSFPGIFSKVRLRPLPELLNWRVTWENGQQDLSINHNERVHLRYDLHNTDSLNAINEVEITNLEPLASVQYFQYNNTIPPGGIAINDSLFLELVGPSQGDSMTFLYAVAIDGHQLEILSSSYPLVAWNPHPVWGDTVEVQSIVGATDNVFPIVADPSLLTGHTYRLNFFEDINSGDLLWRLIDFTIGSVKLDNLEIATSPNHPHPVVDGIQWQVFLPPLAIKDWGYTSGIPSPLYPNYNQGRWLSGEDWGGSALFGGLGMAHIFWGEDPGVAPADFKTVEFRFTYMTAYDDLDGNGEYTLLWGPNGEGEPYYFDTSQGQKAFMYKTWATGTVNYNGFNDIPFQAWDVNDPNNPRQLNVVIRDRDENTRWDIGHGDGPYNYVWILADDYDPTGQRWDPANGADHDFFNLLLSGPVPAYYVLWGVQRGIRPFLAESGELIMTPYRHNAPGDILEVVSPTVGIEDHNIPVTFFLQQNYPNPFNPETHIQFGLAQKVKVQLLIYNVLGQQVKKLINQNMPPGKHEVIWDGRNNAGKRVGSGIYFYNIKAGEFTKTRKMVLLK